MEPTLSVFFGTDRTYLSLLGPGKKGADLKYINSTASTIKDESDYLDVLAELEEILPSVAAQAAHMNLCIPAEKALICQFPAVERANTEQLKQLLQLEIKQSHPTLSLDDYAATVYNLAPNVDGGNMMLAAMINKKYLMACEFVLGLANLPLERTCVSQFATHSALLYNYPEQAGNTLAVFTVAEGYIDVGALKKGRLAYYNQIPLSDHANLATACNDEIEKILANKVTAYIDEAFLLGPGITKEDFDKTIGALTVPTRRLNTFRLLTTELSERERDYCARAAHIFPPCIGAGLPDVHSRDEIRLY